ncbi:helix-turn-helix domain-containing protein [Bacillus cereus]
MGRYFDTEPRQSGGKPGNILDGLTPARVRELNKQGIPDKEISIMFERSPFYVSKLKNKWRKQGVWEGAKSGTEETEKRKWKWRK